MTHTLLKLFLISALVVTLCAANIQRKSYDDDDDHYDDDDDHRRYKKDDDDDHRRYKKDDDDHRRYKKDDDDDKKHHKKDDDDKKKAPTCTAPDACSITFTPFEYQKGLYIVQNADAPPVPTGIPPFCLNQGEAGEILQVPRGIPKGLPSVNNLSWVDCGPTDTFCVNSANLGILQSPSRLSTSCNPPGNTSFNPNFTPSPSGSACAFRQFLDFYFFQTFINIPCGCNLNTFYVEYLYSTITNGPALDDGAAVVIFNSKYPKGYLIPGSSHGICCCNCIAADALCQTANLASAFVQGENRLVIVLVDDFPVFVSIQLAFVANGQLLSPVCAAPTACTTTEYNVRTSDCYTMNAEAATPCTEGGETGLCDAQGQCIPNAAAQFEFTGGDDDDDDDDDDHHRRFHH